MEHTLWDGQNLYKFLCVLRMCCLMILQEPSDFFSEDLLPRGQLKRKLDNIWASFSSADSTGLKGTPKKRRKYVREYHSYW